MPSRSYSLYGLNIRSEIPLHAPAGHDGSADLTIFKGNPRSVPAEPAAGELLCSVDYEDGGTAHVRTPKGYSLRYYKSAEFEFDPTLTQVTAHLDPAAESNLLPEFLGASIPAFKLLLSGRVVLHASAVAINGKAVGILAQSGGGKSTIAAMLCRQGCTPVTDDVMTLEWRDEQPWVLPGPTELRLRAGSIALDAGLAPTGTAARLTADGRNAIAFSQSTSVPLPLAALITPSLMDEGSALTLSRLDTNAALAAILGHLRVAGWHDTPALQRLFPEQVRLARTVPIYRLDLPWGAEAGRSILDALATELDRQPA